MSGQPIAMPEPGELPAAQTVEQAIELLERHWLAFRGLANAYPPERMDEPIERGWTRKQLLAHVAAWHTNAADRLTGFLKSGEPQPLGTTVEARNAQVARVAIGLTSGEILHSLDATYARLRRLLGQLSDEQLVAADGWAAELLADNCYRHYAEHAADLQPPADAEPPTGRR